MSKTQDVFGAAPKSVLNKPMMHVQHQEPSGTRSSPTTTGEQDRTLNAVLHNNIQGASLSNNKITLPAGEYFIDATLVGYGAAAKMQSYLEDSSGNKLLLGTSMWTSGSASYSGTIHYKLVGKFTLSEAEQVSLVTYSSRADDGGFGLEVSNATEVYVDAGIWKLDSNVETPVISDPTMTLARPLMHVQDQKPTGTDGGSLTGGVDNDRDLNTILTNEISGASLSSNEIILPAGTYYVDAQTKGYFPNGSVINTVRKSDDTLLLRGVNTYTTAVGVEGFPVSGRITLTETTAIKLSTYTTTTRTNGGGVQSSIAPYEVYTDIRIWQLDAVNKQPVLINDKLYPLPGNVIVTGNMHGLEYEYTAPNEITVQAGICMDSVNETVLTLANPQLVTIPSGVSTVYNLFLTDDGQLVKTDTDVDGANLPAQDKRRWVGFVTTDGSGNIISFSMYGDQQFFDGLQFATFGTSATAYSYQAYIPSSRIVKLEIGIGGAGASWFIATQGNKASKFSTLNTSNPIGSVPLILDPTKDVVLQANAGGGYSGSIYSVRMKR